MKKDNKTVKFSEKISKLLTVRQKDFDSIEELEKFAGIGRHTIKKAFDENREPTNRIMKILFAALGISREKWENNYFQKNEEKQTKETMSENDEIEYLNRIIEEKDKRIEDKDRRIDELKESITFLKDNISMRQALSADKTAYR